MSKKLVYKALADDASRTEKCSDEHLAIFIAIFEHAVKSTDGIMADRACFDLSNFAIAKEGGLERFRLTLEKDCMNRRDEWCGTFAHGMKTLKVFAALEEEKEL